MKQAGRAPEIARYVYAVKNEKITHKFPCTHVIRAARSKDPTCSKSGCKGTTSKPALDVRKRGHVARNQMSRTDEVRRLHCVRAA